MVGYRKLRTVRLGKTRPVIDVPAVNGGLAALCLVARYLGVPADPDDLRRLHALGDAPVTVAVHFEAEPTVTGDGEQLTAIEL